MTRQEDDLGIIVVDLCNFLIFAFDRSGENEEIARWNWETVLCSDPESLMRQASRSSDNQDETELSRQVLGFSNKDVLFRYVKLRSDALQAAPAPRREAADGEREEPDPRHEGHHAEDGGEGEGEATDVVEGTAAAPHGTL